MLVLVNGAASTHVRCLCVACIVRVGLIRTTHYALRTTHQRRDTGCTTCTYNVLYLYQSKGGEREEEGRGVEGRYISVVEAILECGESDDDAYKSHVLLRMCRYGTGHSVSTGHTKDGDEERGREGISTLQK